VNLKSLCRCRGADRHRTKLPCAVPLNCCWARHKENALWRTLKQEVNRSVGWTRLKDEDVEGAAAMLKTPSTPAPATLKKSWARRPVVQTVPVRPGRHERWARWKHSQYRREEKLAAGVGATPQWFKARSGVRTQAQSRYYAGGDFDPQARPPTAAPVLVGVPRWRAADSPDVVASRRPTRSSETPAPHPMSDPAFGKQTRRVQSSHFVQHLMERDG
jgi:sec-independent protein translocase protein TatB